MTWTKLAGTPVSSKKIANIVASKLHAPVRLIWPVIQEFLSTSAEIVESGRPVYMKGIGTVGWKFYKRREKFSLRLEPAYGLRKGREMEKYGVVLDDEKVKVSEKGRGVGKCPVCGKDLDAGGSCPEHGTEPLEKRPREK